MTVNQINFEFLFIITFICGNICYRGVFMTLIIVIIVLFIILIAIGLYWAFDKAFVRKKGRLFSVESGPLAKYKDIFNDGLKYIDSLECERLYIKSFDG